jgi:arylsulfatase A-like enzyme
MAAFVDQSIFNVTQALKAKGMFENTVLIVTTDNGASYDNGNNYVCCVNMYMMCLCISLIEHFAIKYMHFESSSNSMTTYDKFYSFMNELDIYNLDRITATTWSKVRLL